MASIPPDALPILSLFAPAFSASVFPRAQPLAVACILGQGRRAVSNLLRPLGWLGHGAAPSYHEVLSQAKWSGLRLAALLARFAARHFWPSGPVSLVGDDTVSEHRGKKVYGEGRHRDPVRSSHSYTAYRWGHKWVVLAVLVRFPFATRPWAPPVLAASYRRPEENKRRGRAHKTPAQLMRLLPRILTRWFPDRRLVFAGDAGYGSHEMARFAAGAAGRLALVSKLHPEANLYRPAPAYAGKGRPPKKGARMPSPREVVARSSRSRLSVAWYGGGRREVEVVSGVGHWHKSGAGLAEVLWVFVHDLTGTRRDEYFHTTDVTLAAQEVIERYTGRWNIEATFAETRAYLGLETTRGWCQWTVPRAEPCLFGLYTVVALLYWQLPEGRREGGAEWAGKEGVTFSDALTAVRRWPWADWAFATAGHAEAFAKLPEPVRDALLYALAPAA